MPTTPADPITKFSIKALGGYAKLCLYRHGAAKPSYCLELWRDGRHGIFEGAGESAVDAVYNVHVEVSLVIKQDTVLELAPLDRLHLKDVIRDTSRRPELKAVAVTRYHTRWRMEGPHRNWMLFEVGTVQGASAPVSFWYKAGLTETVWVHEELLQPIADALFSVFVLVTTGCEVQLPITCELRRAVYIDGIPL